MQDKQGQRIPDLAFEMKDAVGDIVQQPADRTMDMRRLAAAMAIGPGKRGPAIEANRFVLFRILDPAIWLNSARGKSARRDISGGFDLPRHTLNAIIPTGASPSRLRVEAPLC